ncbi:MAG: ABC transporter ATP-binding protein [Treponema sp.]|nr:ABC transporter ATP-binding protein [Treponema sp.]
MISIKNLKASYDDKIALEIDDLDFEEGKITAIVGLNGSGKSTLLKAIVGINSYQGLIEIDGKSAKKMGYKKRARLVSFLPQYSPLANLDIYTLVCHGRFPYMGYSKILGEEDKENVEKALRITDLWDIRQKSLVEISGGERQRAYLAMVIAQNTKFILLDEPATYMDIKHQLEVVDVLRLLAREGRGLVITSHDLPQSFSLCDKVCLLKEGHLIEEGKVEQIADNHNLLKEVMGVGLKKNLDKDLVYGFSLCK